MKFLKYLLFFLLLLILLFVLLGLLKSSVNYGAEITVDKSIKEAWAVQQDTTKFHLWLEGFKSIEHISGNSYEVGSKYKVVVNPGDGQPDFEMIETIVSLKPEDHIRLKFDSEMMDFDQAVFFKEDSGKTKVWTESIVEGKGLMMKSMFAAMDLFGKSFHKQEQKNMNALKKLINQNTTQYDIIPIETPE